MLSISVDCYQKPKCLHTAILHLAHLASSLAKEDSLEHPGQSLAKQRDYVSSNNENVGYNRNRTIARKSIASAGYRQYTDRVIFPLHRFWDSLTVTVPKSLDTLR